MRLVGLKLASLLAGNVIDSQVTIFGLVAHNLLAHNLQIVALQTCKLAGVYTSSTGHLILWFLFCSFFSLLLLFNVNQMILKDINIEKIFWIFTTFVRRIFRETQIFREIQRNLDILLSFCICNY